MIVVIPEQRTTFSSDATEAVLFRDMTTFPWKLHEMLDEIENQGFAHIVYWLPDGNGFKILDKDFFINRIMPRYFKQTKYKSFQRQLNMWGFKRIIGQGPDTGGYKHSTSFVRGQNSLCHNMKRTKIKGTGKRRTIDRPNSSSGASLTFDEKSTSFDTEWYCSTFGSASLRLELLLDQDLKYVMVGFEFGKAIHGGRSSD